MMKKSIRMNYKKVWILLSVICVLAIVAGTGAADAPDRPEPASPTEADASAALDKMGASTLPGLMATTATGVPLQDGADRLVDLQNDDGGWDWPLDDGNPASTSPVNTIGPIAKGLAIAYLNTGDPTHLAALQDAGALLLTKTNNFSPSDGYLAAQLDAIFVGTAYVDHVQANFYGHLAAGTYNRNGAGTLYDTAGYVNLIRTARASQGIPNLAAWDIGMGLVGAASAGADTAAWIDGVKAEIDELDGSLDYDVIGLAGAVYGLAFVGEDFDPTAGQHAAAGSLADLADILASYQIDGGGFAWNSLYVIPNDGNETIQETAYAVLALDEVDHAGYQGAILGAVDYMKSVQLPTGGWENYVGSTSGENNEITGEALWAIGSQPSTVVPEIADPLICDEATVDIAISDVSGLYGYEFKVLYDATLVSATGKFQYGWFDTNASGNSPGGWQANCAAGVCKFARTDYYPDPAVSGSGVVASIDFDSLLPSTPSSFMVQVVDIVLTDRDGFAISPTGAGAVDVNVCGNATVQGTLSLQGRWVPNGHDFTVVMVGPYGTFSAPPTIDQTNGTYTVSGVKYGPGGTDYVIRADHSLYLKNELDPLTVSGDITGQDTTLLGGDANNNGAVGIGDLSCIGTDFGTAVPTACGVFPNSTDINDDGFVNIQDLAIGGGNFSLNDLQSW
jgi:hypothetical protein